MQDTASRPSDNVGNSVTETTRGSAFSQHKTWWVVILAACFVYSVLIRPDPSNSQTSWAYALGGTVGILLTAFVLAAIPWLVSVIVRRKMTTRQYISTYTVAVLLVLGANLVTLTHESDAGHDYTSGVGGSLFAPGISDYSITFSSEPNIEEFEVVRTDGVMLKGIRAELSVADSYQRVEAVSMPKGFADSVARESAIADLREYAFHNGITAPEFTFVMSSLGPQASMRGTKVLDNEGRPTAATFEAIAYYGESSLFGVYVSAISENYPPTSVIEFLRSVRKKDK